jgi:galactokinase
VIVIGQSGILESDIDGEPITELGYIFDNEVWGNGYATTKTTFSAVKAFTAYEQGQTAMIERCENGEYDRIFASLYKDVSAARARYAEAIRDFSRLYGDKDATLISAPGRAEIGGNHTDHQHGRALAAAVDLDIICVCAKNDERVIRIQSDEFGTDTVDLSELSPLGKEKGTSAGLIRGVAAWFAARGYPIGGFDAYTASAIRCGVGLASSAAFEVTVGNALKALYKGGVTPTEIALAGQYAENAHFGKPCGLLDQIASSVGGLMMLDFIDPKRPQVTRIDTDLAGYGLCITDTGGSHAALTREYAAVMDEMGAIARHFGKQTLREVSTDEFYRSISVLRQYGDRALLRAMHFFDDNERAAHQAAALERGDLAEFFSLVNESGRSSAALLQNIFSADNPQSQGISLALALSARTLNGHGACRVHGGGFAGTIEAYVPDTLKKEYRAVMEAVFGKGCCHFLKIRHAGGMEVTVTG